MEKSVQLPAALPTVRAVFWDQEGKANAVPDNYVDPEKFLRFLVVNSKVEPLNYMALMLNSVVITQQLSIVIVIFILHFDSDINFTPKHMITILGLGLGGIAIYISWIQCTVTKDRFVFGYHIGQILTCILILMMFAPILRTLTATYSTDTVYALVAACAAAHLYTYDYQYANIVSTRLDCSLSLNSAFLMCLLLASRMADSFQAFSYLLCSISLVLLLPHWLHLLRKYFLWVSNALNFAVLVSVIK